ncbi:hypothetical protein P8452_54888 [Trifolium repens]|nr:hypothetical protein QL285_079636 [Trifolium repens]WJX70820.1 hypothetical protein P8452_54888 [Trifolium repens]
MKQSEHYKDEATEFKEAVGVLPNGVTLYPITDSCCGAGFRMNIPKQYRGVPSYRGNHCRIIIITSSQLQTLLRAHHKPGFEQLS